MLTKSDLQQIGKLVKAILNAELFDFRGEVKKIVKEQIKHLPTKDEFYTKMDKVITELQKVREEQTIQSGWKDEIADLDNRVKKIEKHVGIATSSS